MNVPSYSDWLNNTNAGAFSRRGPKLKALDELIRQQRNANDPALRDALKDYLANEDVGNRNATHAIDKLISAVGLDKGVDSSLVEKVEAYDEWPVPKVDEPVVETPVLPPPPPEPDPQLEKQAEKWTESAVAGRKWTLTSQEVVTGRKWRSVQLLSVSETQTLGVLRKLDAMYTDLNALHIRLVQKLGTTQTNFMACVSGGFNKFKELHRLDAEDLDFNLSIAKGIFGALEALPFPFSVIGKAGGAITGAFKTEQTWGSYSVTIPTPGGIKEQIKEKVSGLLEYRTLNVAPKKLQDHETIIFTFIDFFNKVESGVDDTWKSALSSIDHEEKRFDLVTRRLGAIHATAVQADLDRQILEATQEIGKLGEGIKAQFRDMENWRQVNAPGIANWITVGMIADYAVDGLCSGKYVRNMTVKELGKTRFSAPFAEFLYSNQVKILQLKTAGGSSSGFYNNGRIPWDGSANHIVATMLYLEWFKRTLNPLELFAQRQTPERFLDLSRDYIRRLGTAMAAHKATAIEMTGDLINYRRPTTFIDDAIGEAFGGF